MTNCRHFLKCDFTPEVGWAVKRFLEWWYCTVIVGYTATPYLITFKLGPLRIHTHTHTLAATILPLLEDPEEGFLWNLPEFSYRIRFDVLYVSETRPFEAHFQSKEQPKVTRSWVLIEIFSRRGIAAKQAMCSFVRYCEPLSLPATCLAASSKLNLQYVHAEITSNTLSRRYENMVYQTVEIK